MKKHIVILLMLCILPTYFAQSSNPKFSKALENKLNNLAASDDVLVWVYFTDKGNTNSFYLNNPQLVVSEKSLKRRAKVLGNNSVLTFKDLPVNTDYITQLQSLGFKLKWSSKWLNAVSGYADRNLLDDIAFLSSVDKLDIIYKLKSGNEPESNFNKLDQSQITEQLEGIHSLDYGSSYEQLQQINVPAVHDSGYTGQGITICVMDAGFSRLSHDAFLSMDIIAAWDFVNNDPNVGNQSDMGEGSHGTQTLSTIGGYAPGYLIGPAFNASYILAKTENTDSETPIEEDNWIAALEWADSIGVDVTSTSLGYIDFDPPYTSYTWMDMDGNTTVITNGADYAAYIGIVVVNSAGNEGYSASHNTLGAPADGDSVITAGAVNSSGSRSSFSSVGPTVDGRIKPDIMALGSGNVVASPSNDHNYTTASGTSFSCPLSAGVAALILCANPNLSPMQVRDAMRNTASKSSNPDNSYGWGILNALAAVYYFPPAPQTFQLSVDLNNGWNLVSVPGINSEGMNVDNWWEFRVPGSDVFMFNGIYQPITSTIPGTGYWMKNNGSRIYNTGDEWPSEGIQIVENDPIQIHAGWNLIGIYECPVDINILTTSPPGLVTGSVFGYTGISYVVANILYPGYAYWIKSMGEGWLNIPGCN
jgi:serine protease AprX